MVEQANRRAEIFKSRGFKAEDASTSSFSGWIGSRVSILDELVSVANGEIEDNAYFHGKLRRMAKNEGDINWRRWIDDHIWTYVGLSAPMLGAVNPLRSVISGENMGIPVTDASIRVIELTFGSTHSELDVCLAICVTCSTSPFGPSCRSCQSNISEYRLLR